MKKFLTVLICTFIFLFNDAGGATTNILEETKEAEEKVVVNEIINDVQEIVEKETEEIDNSNAGETTDSNEYIEDNTVYETYSENFGTYGRLYVSWYDVALYDYNVYTSPSTSLQELVDNYDSAAFYANKGRLVIADHNTQGFSALYDLYEGSYAYIKFADGSTIGYTLIKKEKGYNTGYDLVDSAGNSFYNMDSNLIMYTCYEDGIMVTLWV